MRHKDILLNKSHQMFVEDLFRDRLESISKRQLFAFQITPLDRSDELRPRKRIQNPKWPGPVEILILEHLTLLEVPEVLRSRCRHGFRPAEKHLRTHVCPADGHGIHHVHGKYGSLEFILGRVRHYLNLGKGDFIHFHGQDEADPIIFNLVGYFEGLLFQADKAEHNTVTFQYWHRKIPKTAAGSASAFLGNIDIHTGHRIGTVGIEDNTGELNDFFFLLILGKRPCRS